MDWIRAYFFLRTPALGLSIATPTLTMALVALGTIICFAIGASLFRRPRRKPGSAASLGSHGDSTGLEQYFTDVEQTREQFAALLTVPTLSKRLFVIHGIGGIGKSSLLRMFRLHSRKVGVPVALASGDEVNSPAEILYSWARDLESWMSLPGFTRELAQYRDLVRTVEKHANDEHRPSTHTNTSKAVLKGVVQGVGSAAGLIPGIGLPLSILLGGASDTLVDWLHGFLSKHQIDLLLDPTEQLTERFLSDLAEVRVRHQKSTPSRRIVLLLDTYEKLLTLDPWLAHLAQQLPPDVLLVVAGQTIPNGWSKHWPDWMTYATIEELTPMTEEVMRQLVQRYYAARQGAEPPPAQVEAIIRFARGLPIAVTTVVQIWLQYGVEDFQAVKPQVVADLVDHLTDGIPEQMRVALKAAATLRWFNLEVLRGVGGADVITDGVYTEIRRFPFIRPHRLGHALHDSVREYLDENLRLEEPARHHELHTLAAAYFHHQVEQASADAAGEAMSEELYHLVMADEERGMQRLCASAEELVRYQLVSQLRALITDLAKYPLQRANSQLWRDYYRARLFDLEGHGADAAELYQAVADNERTPDRLRAYALVDWAWITRQDRKRMHSALQRFRALFPDPDALVEPDSKLGFALVELAELHWGEWDEMLGYLERARRFYQRVGDTYWLPFAYNRLKYYYLDRGMWRPAIEMQRQGLAELNRLASERERTYLRAELLGGVAVGWMWAGQYHHTEQMLREALALAERFQRVQQEMYFRRDLGLVLGLQGRLEDAQHQFAKGLEIGPQLNPLYEDETRDFQAIVLLKCQDLEDAAPLFALGLDAHLHANQPGGFRSTFLVWYGTLHEQRGALDLAEQCYRECLALRELPWHWQAGALVGLVRIAQARADATALALALNEADELLRQHAFPQHLASLRLSQAHLAWEGRHPGGEQGVDAAFRLYQEALLYALNYNRFLLDEVLSGPPDATPLQPIIPHCLARGPEGERMLSLLANWWSTALLQSLVPDPERITPLPTDVALATLEQQVRAEEPGTGHDQPTLTMQIHAALEKRANGHA